MESINGFWYFMENDFLNGVYVEEWEHSGKSDRFLCPDFKKPNGKNGFNSYNHNNDKIYENNFIQRIQNIFSIN